MFIYSLITNSPANVAVFPPSIVSSGYLDKLAINVNKKGVISEFGNQYILFDTEQEMNDWLNETRLTDPELVSDLAAWKAAHNISFVTKVYEVESTNITVNPIL